ncbi:MAG: phosphoglycerate kinase [bacterium]
MQERQYFEDILSVADVALAGKRVLVRADFNVPLTKHGTVADDFRIRSSIPTVSHILREGGLPILASHLGRPKGKPVPEFSMRPVRDTLQGLLSAKVHLAPDCVGDQVVRMALSLGRQEVLLLENLRFHAEEEANEPAFCRGLAALGEVYVNDAFGTAHRAHASTEGVAKLVRPAVAGLLMQREIAFLGKLLVNPARPFVAILGGAKISDKIEVLKSLVGKVDAMLVGGGMANTFLRSQGFDVGDSLCEHDSLGVAREIIDLARDSKVELSLPVDFVAADRLEAGASTVTLAAGDALPEGFAIADIGPGTIESFRETVGRARTVFWNGPPGVFEIEGFSRGTFEVARAVARASDGGAVSVVGGGDTANAVARAGVAERISHISTGGGASLEFVEGRRLPGIAALSKKEEHP